MSFKTMINGVTSSVKTYKASFVSHFKAGMAVQGGMPQSKQDDAYVPDKYEQPSAAQYPEPGAEHPDYAEENAVLKKEFHMYVDVNDVIRMEPGYVDAYKDTGLSKTEIQAGYAKTLSVCQDGASSDLETRMYGDMALYYKVHDAEYMSTLDTGGLNSLMSDYMAWEAEHAYTYTDENGVEQRGVRFGVTAAEYDAMPAADRVAIDEQTLACTETWQANNRSAFDEYVTRPDVQDETQNPGTDQTYGFWDNLRNRATDMMTTVRDMVASTSVGAWAIETFESVRDRVTSIFHKDSEEPELTEVPSDGRGEQKDIPSEFYAMLDDNPSVPQSSAEISMV